MAAGVWCEREEILRAVLSVGISGGEILRDGSKRSTEWEVVDGTYRHTNQYSGVEKGWTEGYKRQILD